MKLTATHGVIAMKGSGKTWRAMALAEKMLDDGGQIVAVDPTGAWWGLRLREDGKTVAYPNLLVLGANGSLPLADTMGEAVARLVVDKRLSVVLDLSDMPKAGMRRFVTAFTLELYRSNPGRPLHMFVDEADLFAPEQGKGDAANCTGAMADYFRRGRRKGLGGTLITQRVQAIAKDVLWQCEAMTILRLKGTHDIKAIKDWLDSNGFDAKRIAGSLPKLRRGDRYECIGEEAAFIPAEKSVHERKTFDSSRTPEPGDETFAPPPLDEKAIENIRTTLGEAAAEIEANDPKRLRSEVARLKRELQEAGRSRQEVPKPEVRVERYVPSEIVSAMEAIEQVPQLVRNAIEEVRRIAMVENAKPAAKRDSGGRGDARAGEAMLGSTEPRPVAASAPPVPPGDEGMSKGQRAILAVLAAHGMCTREKLSIMTGYKRSSRNTYLQQLNGMRAINLTAAGASITDEGFRLLGPYQPLPVGENLRKFWRDSLPQGERALFDILCRLYPYGIGRADLGDKAGYKRSSCNTYLQRLATRGLVEVTDGYAKAAEELFEDA